MRILTVSEKTERQGMAGIIGKVQENGLTHLTTSEFRRFETYEKKVHARMRAEALRSCTAKELMDMLSATRRMVLKWVRHGMPANGDGSYNLFKVLPWLKERWFREFRLAIEQAMRDLIARETAQ